MEIGRLGRRRASDRTRCAYDGAGRKLDSKKPGRLYVMGSSWSDFEVEAGFGKLGRHIRRHVHTSSSSVVGGYKFAFVSWDGQVCLGTPSVRLLTVRETPEDVRSTDRNIAYPNLNSCNLFLCGIRTSRVPQLTVNSVYRYTYVTS